METFLIALLCVIMWPSCAVGVSLLTCLMAHLSGEPNTERFFAPLCIIGLFVWPLLLVIVLILGFLDLAAWPRRAYKRRKKSQL